MALMNSSPQSRSKAANTRTMAQVAALVAAVAAGGAVAANFIAGPEKTEVAKIEVRELKVGKFDPSDAAQAKADLEGIASRMILVSNSPKISEPEKIDSTLPPPAPPSCVKDHVRFLGVVADGARFYALIAADGRQRIVAVGDVIKLAGDATATVTAITADSISFDDGKKIEKIELAHRSGAVVSQGAAQPAVSGGTAVNASSGRMLQDPRVRGGKPAKDALAGLDPKARAIVEQNNAKAAQAALEVREIRRKTRRMELERETGRTGEEVEKLLDEMEQAGKFNEALKENPAAKEKGGK